ncbi:PO113 protein, partial [Origma solitaria]|nr:PO113 protein [Origma solitaria]
VHQLCGQINWIRPYLGISTEILAPLFNLLRGDRDLTSPRMLTPETRDAVAKVADALANKKSHRFDPKLPFQLAVLGKMPHPYGLICQWDEGAKDPLLIL